MSVKLREMLGKRNKAVTEARAFIDKADAEKRTLTEEEQKQCDAFLKEAGDLRDNIDRENRLLGEELAIATIKIGEGFDKEKDESPDAKLRTKAFRNLLIGGVQNLSPEEYRALSAGVSGSGGFLTTPQEFVKQLIAKVKDNVFVRGLGTVLSTTNANGLGFPSLETDANDADWSTEITSFNEDTALAVGRRELKPHPLKKLIKVSDKLLRADGIDAESLVMDRAAYKFGITEEKAFLTGDGNQKPLGLFTASAQGISTGRDVNTDMTTTDFTPDALKTVKYGLKAQYMTKAQWLFHRDGVAKIAKLKDAEGSYIFEMAESIGALDVLLGRPLNMSEYVPNTFTTGLYVGMFGDFSWYYIADALSLRIKRLNELYAATSQVGFIFDKETDGMPVLEEAFVRIKTA